MPALYPAIEILEARIAPAMLELSGTLLGYTAAAGITNNLTIDLVVGNYTFTDTAETITLGANALAAGFTGSGTNTVTGPASALASIRIQLDNGNDTLNVNGLVDGLQVLDGLGSDTVNLDSGAGIVNDSVTITAETVNVTALTGVTTLTLEADTLAVNGNVGVTGTVNLRVATAGRPINLGTETGGSMSLTATELGRFSAPAKLSIGRSDAGAITISAALNITNTDVLALRSNEGITDTGAGAIAVDSLAIDVDTAVVLDGAHDVNVLAVNVADAGAGFRFTDADGYQIGTVDGITGITTNTAAGGNVVLEGPSISQAAGARIVANGLAFIGTGGSIFLNDPANDVTTLAANLLNFFEYTDANALDIGTVAGTSGITTQGQRMNVKTVDGDLRVLNGNASVAPDISTSLNGSVPLVELTAGSAPGQDRTLILEANAGIFAREIRITADHLTIGAKVEAGEGGLLVVTATTDLPIDLGGADAPGVLGLSAQEFNFFDSPKVTIGGFSSSPVTLSGAISPADTGLIFLRGSSISGGGSIQVPSLSINIEDSIAMDGANDVDFLDIRTQGGTPGTISFADADGFSLGAPGLFTQVATAGIAIATLNAGSAAVNFGPDSAVPISISDPTPGTGHDQVVVQGLVNLTGSQLRPTAIGTLALGSEFIILSNDGTDAISGIFLDQNDTPLPEGASLVLGNVLATISYVGGDGNDVVLTTPPPLAVQIAPGGKSATFRDVDGDLVMVKTSKGAFDGSEFSGIETGPNGAGQLQRLMLDADFSGANITFTAKPGAAGGNGFVNIGFLDATGVDLGTVSVPGDLSRLSAGTVGETPERPALKSLTVQSLGVLGSSTQGVGSVFPSVNLLGALPKLTISGDLRTSISIDGGAAGKLGSAFIGGSFVPITNSISLSADGGIGSLKIAGDIRSTASAGVAIQSDGAIGSINVGGSIAGDSIVNIRAFGQLTAPTKGADIAIKSINVRGSVESARIEVGSVSTKSSADASIGSITVGGDWIASNVVTASQFGTDAIVGTNDDNLRAGANVRDNPAIFSTLGSFTVKGQALGTATMATDMFSVIAERIGKAKVGGRTFAFIADKGATQNREAFFAAPTFDGEGAENPAFDFTIRELGSTTPSPAFGGSNLVISTDGKTATFIDMDGDLVTVKRSAGAFVAGDFTIADNAAGGGQLSFLTITPAPNGAAFDLSIKAKPGPDGGNGFVNVGAINAVSVALSTISVSGDVGGFAGGVVNPGGFGVKSFTSHSLRALGNSTGSASLNITFAGGVGKVVVQADSHDAELRSTGTGGRFSSVTVGGFVEAPSFGSFILAEEGIGSVAIGGTVNRAQIVVTKGAIGSVTIGGFLIGDPSKASISAFGQLTPPTKGLDLAIKSLTVKGTVENARIEAGTGVADTNADAGIGKVNVGHNWLASHLLAGVAAGADTLFGTADDTKDIGTTTTRDEARFSTIASILIKGQALGSTAAGDAFGIVAEQITKTQIGKVKLKLDKGERDAADAFAIGTTGDFFLREIVV